MKVTKQEHYGTEVFVNIDTESVRRNECLCLNCDLMKPGDDNCHIANQLYQICKTENVALTITRCPIWQPKADKTVYHIVEFHGDGGQMCVPARRSFADPEKAEEFADQMKNEEDHRCGPESVLKYMTYDDPGDDGYLYPEIADIGRK